VWSAALSADGRLLATASQDQTVRLWDVAMGLPLGLPLGHPKPVRAVAFTPDGKRLLTGSMDGVGRLWSVPALTDDAKRLALRAQVATGLELTPAGTVRPLTREEWEKRREGLAKADKGKR